jgi:hypothetical protein
MEFALRHFVEIYEDFLYWVAQPGDRAGPFLFEVSPEPFSREERVELLERTPSDIRFEQWKKYLRDRGPILLGVVRQLQVETVPLGVQDALLRVIELDAWEAARLDNLDLFVESLDEPMFHGTLGFLAEDWSAWLENPGSGAAVDCADAPPCASNANLVSPDPASHLVSHDPEHGDRTIIDEEGGDLVRGEASLDDLHEGTRRIAEQIMNKPGLVGEEIAKEIGCHPVTVRRNFLKHLKRLGFSNNRRTGYQPPVGNENPIAGCYAPVTWRSIPIRRAYRAMAGATGPIGAGDLRRTRTLSVGRTHHRGETS